MYKLDGVLNLCRDVKLNNSYLNTFSFSSKEEQYGYFNSHTVLKIENTPTIKNKAVRINKSLQDLDRINYCFYKNNQLSRFVYSFIIDKVYISETVTDIYLDIDVMQTFQFDYELGSSFIIREHMDRWSSKGNPIWNTTQEQIPYGNEYIEVGNVNVTEDSSTMLVATTEPLTTWNNEDVDYKYGGIPSPLHYYLIDRGNYDGKKIALFFKTKQPYIVSARVLTGSVSELGLEPSGWITVGIDVDGIIDTIVIQKVKKRLSNDITFPRYIYPVIDSYNNASLGIGIQRTPAHESKLLQHPYYFNCLVGSNGQNIILKNERLKYGISPFNVKCKWSFIDDIRYNYYIEGYNGDNEGRINRLEVSEMGNLPILSDAYVNYKIQNSFSTAFGIVGSIATGVATSIITANPVGLVGTAASVLGQLGSIIDIKNTPDKLDGNGSDMAHKISTGDIHAKIKTYSIDDNYRQLLADFFAKFGYQCNRVKKPNLKSRYYYNFIQTNGANIVGNVDMYYCNIIRDNFDRGITIWHYNGSEFNMSYEYDNVERRFI